MNLLPTPPAAPLPPPIPAGALNPFLNPAGQALAAAQAATTFKGKEVSREQSINEREEAEKHLLHELVGDELSQQANNKTHSKGKEFLA